MGKGRFEMRIFSKEDVVKLVQEKTIEIINLCHIPEDCRLKALSFTCRNRRKLEEILELGERVDGSSLFSYVDPNKSDIYIMPKIESAFIDPFSPIPALNILCEYLDENGNPLNVAPENILLRAEDKLNSSTRITLKAMAELEFYTIYKEENNATQFPDKSYHESSPFSKFGNMRNKAIITLEDIGVDTKYGHAEVGKFYSKKDFLFEQHEIEFLPKNLRKMAESITIAKWVLRNTALEYGVSASFAPKPAFEHVGNGMHIHFCAVKNNKNIIVGPRRKLTKIGKEIIGGLLKFAPSLTAFGNTIPASYLRFVSRKESPMHICWGTTNRLALIRIPLWWNFRKDFTETEECRRTLEFRAPDPSANTYLLLAGIVVAVEYGLRNPKEALQIAEDLNVDKDRERNKKYGVLPLSCAEAADSLKKDRKYYEADGIFPKRVIDAVVRNLESYKDRGLWKKLENKREKTEELLWKYLDYG